MTFTHLHGHSTFSFLEAIGKPDAIVNQAKELGMGGIAITDKNALYGAFSFYNIAKAEAINPIVGIEVGFILNISDFSNQDIGHICVLAKNEIGYQNILKVTSFANKQGIHKTPKIDLDVLEKNKEGLLVFMGGKNSRIGKMIGNGESLDKISEIINKLTAILGKENVFLEIIAQDENLLPGEGKINKNILNLSKINKIPCIVNNVFNYPKAEDKYPWEVALSIKDGTKMYDEFRRSPKGEYHIMNEDEIKNICKKNGYSDEQINERIATNNKIAEGINISIKMGQSLFPKYDTPEEIKELYEKHINELVIKKDE